MAGGDEVVVKMLEIAKDITFDALQKGRAEADADAKTLAKNRAEIFSEVFTTILKTVKG